MKEEIVAAMKRCALVVSEDFGTVRDSALVGSQFITGEGEDIDVLILAAGTKGFALEEVFFEGWEYGGSTGAGLSQPWGSWKNGRVNLLLTTDAAYFQAWVTAAEVCRLLHKRGIVVPKNERLMIHNIVMDESCADDEVNRAAF